MYLFNMFLVYRPLFFNRLIVISDVCRVLQALHFSFLFMAAPAAYESSQARDGSRAATMPYATNMATVDLSCICALWCCFWQHWILNPLRRAKAGTLILTDVGSLTC